MNHTSNAVDPAIETATHYDEFYGPMFFEPYAIEVANRIDPASVSVALRLLQERAVSRATYENEFRLPRN